MLFAPAAPAASLDRLGMFSFLRSYFPTIWRDRPNGQYADLRAQPRYRPRRAVGRCHSHGRRPERQKTIRPSARAPRKCSARRRARSEVIRPMKDGVIADFTVTEQMLKQFIRKVQ